MEDTRSFALEQVRHALEAVDDAILRAAIYRRVVDYGHACATDVLTEAKATIKATLGTI